MPETRRSNRGGPGSSELERQPSRQSSRTVRKNQSAEEAEAKAKAQRIISEQKTDTASKSGAAKGNAASKPATSAPAYPPYYVDERISGGADFSTGGEELSRDVLNDDEIADAQTEMSERASQSSITDPDSHTMEFTVPLPLTGVARSQYKDLVSKQAKSFKSLAEKPKNASDSEKEAGYLFLERLRDLCFSLDLYSARGHVENPEAALHHYPTASSKFKVFGKIVDEIKAYDIHVLIIAPTFNPMEGTKKSNLLEQMLASFIAGKKVSYSIPRTGESFSSPNPDSKLRMTLSLSNPEDMSQLTGPFQMIINWDQGLESSRPDIKLLRQTSPDTYLVPFIRFTVLDTIDHVERVMSPLQTGLERLAVELLCVTTLKMKALPVWDNGPTLFDEYATLFGDFVGQGFLPQAWSIPSLAPLSDHESYGMVLRDKIQAIKARSGSNTPNGKKSKGKAILSNIGRDSTAAGAGGTKRSRGNSFQSDADSQDAHAEKKIRVGDRVDTTDDSVSGDAEMHQTVEADDRQMDDGILVDTLVAADSTAAESKGLAASSGAIREANKAPGRSDAPLTAKLRQGFLRTIDEAEQKISELKGQVVQLEQHRQMSQENYGLITNNLDRQMNIYEDVKTEAASLRARLEESEGNLEVAETVIHRGNEKLASARDENSKLKSELGEVRLQLENSGNPAVAERELLSRRNRELEESLQKSQSLSRSKDDTNAMLYQRNQDADRVNSELNEENQALRARLEIAERLASELPMRLERQNFIDWQGRMNKENDDLKRRCGLLQVDVDALHRRLRDEQAKSQRPGVNTRAGSVPQSPRVGPTSRATSPAPVDRRVEHLRGGPGYQRQGKTSAAAAEKPATSRKGKGSGAGSSPKEKESKRDAKKEGKSQAKKDQKKDAKGDAKGQPKHEGILDLLTGKPGDATASGNSAAELTSPHKGSGFEAINDPKLPDLQPAYPGKAQGNEEEKHRKGKFKSRGKGRGRAKGPGGIDGGDVDDKDTIPCGFACYGCDSQFSSKNEWKRHLSTKHTQTWFWRCLQCPPGGPQGEAPAYNDFNRKDLFMQHLRRMHTPQGQDPENAPKLSQEEQLAQDAELNVIQKRCYTHLRTLPPRSNCVFCNRVFTGPSSWEDRLEHIYGHLEGMKKDEDEYPDPSTWHKDPELEAWLLEEGLIDIDPRGGFMIGDGRPRNRQLGDRKEPVPVPPGSGPVTPNTPTGTGFGSEGNGDNQTPTVVAEMGSMSRRRRGRPPRRVDEFGNPLKLHPAGPLPNISPHPITTMSPLGVMGLDSRGGSMQPASPAPGAGPTSAAIPPPSHDAMQIDSMGGHPIILPPPTPTGRPILPSPIPAHSPSAPSYASNMTLPPPSPQYPPMSLGGPPPSHPPGSQPPPLLPQLLPRGLQSPQTGPSNHQNRVMPPLQNPLAAPYSPHHGHAAGPSSHVLIAPAPTARQMGSPPSSHVAPPPFPPLSKPGLGPHHPQAHYESADVHQYHGPPLAPVSMQDNGPPPPRAPHSGGNADAPVREGEERPRGRSFRDVIM